MSDMNVWLNELQGISSLCDWHLPCSVHAPENGLVFLVVIQCEGS